jgi:hypothetical protein
MAKKNQITGQGDGQPDKVETLSRTCTCPIEGCGRALDLEVVADRPDRMAAICNCERFRGRAVVETDAVAPDRNIENETAPEAALNEVQENQP